MPKEKPLKPTTVAKVNKIKRLKQPFVAELANAGVANWKRVKAQADFDGFCEFMGLLYGDKAEQKIAVERSVKYFSVKLKIDKVEEVGKQFLQASDGLAKAVAEDAGPKPEELQKRLAKLQDEFNASTGATDNQVAEIKLRFDQANMYINSNRPDLEKAVKVLEEAAQWISQIQPEDDLDSEPDDGEPLIDPKQLKKFMKMSKNRAHPFACGLATDGLAYTMNKPAKKPKALAKNVKTATGATKLCFGMATLEGKILVLDLDPQKKPLPGLLRKMKKWLKENKPLPANKVRLMQGGEEVPLSPDEFLEILADYEAIVPGVLSSGEGDTQRIRVVWAFVNEKAAAEDYAAAWKALANLDDLLEAAEGPDPNEAKWQTEQGKLADLFEKAMKLNPENRTKLTAAWGMATESADGGNYTKALTIAAKLKPALQAVLGAGGGDQSTVLKSAITEWEKAFNGISAELKKVEKRIADSKHPSANKALIELKAVRSQLSGTPDTLQKVSEIEKYLEQDDVVKDVCDLAQDIRTPLLAIIAAHLKPALQ